MTEPLQALDGVIDTVRHGQSRSFWGGGGEAQWVTFVSPQAAPTATAAAIALSLVHQISVLWILLSDRSMAGVGGRCPYPLLHYPQAGCRLLGGGVEGG